MASWWCRAHSAASHVDYGAVWTIREPRSPITMRHHEPPVSGMVKRERMSTADLVESLTKFLSRDPWRHTLPCREGARVVSAAEIVR